MARGQGKQPVSFRFNPQTISRLRRRSREAGAPQAALAERYIDEGLRMDEHPGIYFREGGSGRRPALLGSRLDVAQVIETLRQNNNSLEETAEYLDLAPNKVEVALRYYAAYTDEIDEWIGQSRAVAEHERELWLRREEVLGR